MRAAFAIGSLALVAAAALAAAPGQADPSLADKGRAAFAACATCHGTAAGQRKMGPTLFGVVGRKAGTEGSPSPAMAKSGLTWTPDKLDAFLASPRKVVPGNRMPYPGMNDPAKREAVIAYLKTLK